MKQLQLTQIRVLDVIHSEVPCPAPGETVLSVSYCALCRTDAKMWQKGQRDLRLPRVLGHEFVGIKEDSHERFAVWPGDPCSECLLCRTGMDNLCPDIKILGFNRDGGLAEKVVVPDSSLVAIPSELPDREATLAEPLACAMNAVEQASVAEGDEVLILGGGPVGFLMSLAVKKAGGSPFVVEPDPEKLRSSEAFRSSVGVQASTSSPSGNFDVAINATSATDAFLWCLDHLKAGARFCFFSGLPNEDSIPAKLLNEVHYRQLTISGAYGCARRHFVAALELLSEEFDHAGLLIQREITLEEVSDALPAIASGKALKVLVRINPPSDPHCR
jgi:L-iditol 2-dehydrogenase